MTDENIRPGASRKPDPHQSTSQLQSPLRERSTVKSAPDIKTDLDSDDEEVSESENLTIPPNYTWSPAMDQIALDHPLRTAWIQFHSKFFDIIEAANPSGPVSGCPAFLPLSADRRYLDEAQTAIFIIYLSQPDIIRQFDKEVDPHIRDLIDTYMFSTDGEIPIRYYHLDIVNFGLSAAGNTKTVKSHTSTPAPTTQYTTHEHGESYMGHGLSVRGSLNSGTILGFVNLVRKEDGKEEPGVYAITCHHIVTNLEEKESVPKGDIRLRPLQSPATKDHLCTMEDASKQIDRALIWLSKSYQMLSLNEKYGRLNVDQITQRLKDAEKKFQELHDFNTSFGQTIWTSGLVEIPPPAEDPFPNHPLRLDLAIVKLDATRKVFNKLPPTQDAQWPLNENHKEDFKCIDSRETTIFPRLDWRKEELDKLPIIKYGRTTRVTEADFSHDRHIVTNNKERFGDHCIWASSTKVPVQWPEPLSWFGDSGSPVISAPGMLIGMLFAGSCKREREESKVTISKKPGRKGGKEETVEIVERDMSVIMRWDTIERAITELTPWSIEWFTGQVKEPDIRRSKTPVIPMPNRSQSSSSRKSPDSKSRSGSPIKKLTSMKSSSSLRGGFDVPTAASKNRTTPADKEEASRKK